MRDSLYYQNLSDMELSERIREADRHAFEEVYHRYWGVLFRHALKMLKDEEEAGDVVQDVFMNLWAKADKLLLKSSLSAYLYTVTRNKIITLMNRQKYQVDYLDSLKAYINAGEWQTDNSVRERELKMIIEQEINKLPAKMRQIFELSRNAYLSYKAIAEEVNLTEGTVKKQVYNALKILRSKIGMFLFLKLMIFILLINRI